MKTIPHLSKCLVLICIALFSREQTIAQVTNPFTHVKGQRQAANRLSSGKFNLTRAPLGQSNSGKITKAKSLVRPSQGSYKQISPVQHASRVESRYELVKDEQGQLPIYFSGRFNGSVPLQANVRQGVESSTFQYLDKLKNWMRVTEPREEFSIRSVSNDDLNQTHIRLQQYYKGVEVYGSEIFLHARNGTIDRMNGRYFPTPELSTTEPSIPVSEAILASRSHLKTRSLFHSDRIGKEHAFEVSGEEPRLQIYHTTRDPEQEHLVWHITVRPNVVERWEYFVDARSGEILDFFNNTCSDGPATASSTDLMGQNRTINTFLSGGNFFLIDASRPMFNASQSSIPDNPVGAIWTIDANNTFGNGLSISQVTSSNNTWNNPTAVSAHHNAALSYQYYLNTHSRNSINGEGGSIISVINMPNEDGSSMGNAFWNGQAMFYGNGDASFFSLARALDVAGHEMTHGVTEKSAGLEYRDQSGAINESMSDVFGALIERNNFKIGEDVVRTSSFPSGALRDMSDPHNGGTGLSSPGWQPAHMSEFINTTQDNGGVHINSGIPNKAFFLFASSTTLDKAEDVYYRALTTYLTKNSQFIDLRIAVIQAATDLFGSGSGEVNAARSAFDAVGITSGSGGGGSTQTLAMNPGDSYILLTDAPIQTSTTLWATDSIQSFFLEISSTPLKSKPSVTDDGSMAYFVAADGTVHRVELTSPPVETIIDNSPIWHNVAVSKDGLRLALNTEGQDSSIVIVDLNSGNGVVYRLFNPTTAQGQVVENVIFADALEWDYSDQFVMYDAFSLLQNASGQDIDFWDVGFLEAWDSQANTFGSGNIEKLFSNLPEGISIGNPAFSKNSPNIIAFDMLDLSTGSATFAVLGSDLQSGEVGTIFNNNTIGWPNFSKSDNQVLFTSISSDTVIGIINLQPDKINAAGSASEFISLAKWPVWIAQGSRSLISVPELGNTIGEFTLYPNPAEDQLMILYNLKEAGSTSICLFDLSGNKVAYWNYHDVPGAVLHEVDLGEISQGIYTVQIRTGKAVARKLLVHTK